MLSVQLCLSGTGRFSNLSIPKSFKISALNDIPELERLTVVLVSTRNPLNIGAAARAMSNFGFGRLRLVNPWEPSYQESRSAVGAGDLLARAEVYSDLTDAIADCSLVVGTTAGRNRELQHQMQDLPAATVLIRDHLKTGAAAALLFGSEKTGLTNNDLSHCHWLLRIATREEHISMNLGQAVAVCLYALSMEVTAHAAPAASNDLLASTEDLERITHLLFESLNASEYVKSGSEASSEEKLRMLIRRLRLSPADATTLQGMLRQILWKLRSGTD